MKNVRDAGFSRKSGGNAGSGPSLPDPANQLGGMIPRLPPTGDIIKSFVWNLDN